MNKKIFALAVGALSSLSMAASLVGWSYENPKTGVLNATWYTYGDSKVGASATQSTTTEGYKVLTAKVSTTNESSSAGVSIDYKTKPTSLADYKGVCLTYTATHPFKMDFKQSNFAATNYNYNGYVVPAQKTMETLFIDFEKLEQEPYWGEEVAFDASKQTGIQFSYKQGLAKEAGSASNTITIAEVKFANSCVDHEPVLLDPYKTEMANSETMTPVVLKEMDTLKLDLSKVFFDEDDDELAVTVEVFGSDLTFLNKGTSFTNKDVLLFTPVVNKDGEASVIITATDGKTTLEYAFDVQTENVNNAPKAVNDSYTTDEDTKLVVSMDKGIFMNDYDPDGETEGFLLNSFTKPSHGTLTLDEEEGSFTYEPDADWNGTDTWTYTLVSDDAEALVSNKAIVTIKVNPVNDPLVIDTLDLTALEIGDIELDEDFATDYSIKISSAAVSITDPDVEASYTIGVKTKGVVAASYRKVTVNHIITLKSVLNAYGEDVVEWFAVDGKDTTIIATFNVVVNPVADPPLALADSFTVKRGDTLKVAAAKGVLANDVNPDDPTVGLIAVLDEEPAFGSVELNEDGSFTYVQGEKFLDKDSFTYHALNVDGEESAPVVVTISCNSPYVVVNPATLDTTAAEEFTKALVYLKTTMDTWFKNPNGKALTYSAKSVDGKLDPVFTTTGALQIKSVKDSTGDAYVEVCAKDATAGTATLTIYVKLTPVNDKPVGHADTVVVEHSGWEEKIDVSKLFFDVDGDELTYSISVASATLTASLEDNILTVIPAKDSLSAGVHVVRVSASDGKETCTGTIYFDVGGTTAIAQVAAPKASWKTAITATRGTVAIFDMHGRVLWHKALPASEAEVKAIMQKNAGNAILRVKGQQWMLNGKVQ